jgi:hypothetical protein
MNGDPRFMTWRQLKAHEERLYLDLVEGFTEPKYEQPNNQNERNPIPVSKPEQRRVHPNNDKLSQPRKKRNKPD